MRDLLLTGLFLYFIPRGSSLGTEYLACIDDSDCVDLGHKYACFMYMCYPWKDPDSEEHPICTSDWDCWFNTGKCFRHHRVRQISKGVCFREINSCFKHEDCPSGYRCCGKHCCPLPYFEAWKEFSCFSDVGCQSLKLGPRCCPQTQRCCGGENEEEFFSTLSPTIFESVDYPLSISTVDADDDYGETAPILPEEHQLTSAKNRYDEVEEDESLYPRLCEDDEDAEYLSSHSPSSSYSTLLLLLLISNVFFRH